MTWCWTDTTGKNISDSSWSKTWTIIRVTVPAAVVLEISWLVTLGNRLSILLCQPSENSEGSLGSILNGYTLSVRNWPNFNISKILHQRHSVWTFRNFLYNTGLWNDTAFCMRRSYQATPTYIILVARQVGDRPKREYECGKQTERHVHLKKHYRPKETL